MGAVEIETSNHVYPAVALKGRNYKCPECQKPVIFRNGKIKAKHFAHTANSNCTFYSHPNESEIHREAKRQMCAYLNNKRSLIIQRKCLICPHMKEYELSKFYTESSSAKVEHHFDPNNRKYSADVALIDNDITKFIVEIHETHRTKEDRRSEPWVELEAIDVINQINYMNDNKRINCIRDRTICDSCVKSQIEQEQIRIELEQKKEQRRIELEKKQKEEMEEEYQKWLAGADERAERQKKWLAGADERAEKERKRIQEKEEKEKKMAAELERRQRSFEERKEREKKWAAEAAIRKEQYDKEREMEQNYFFKALEEIRKEEQDKTINPPQT
jgi:hypothetical protein